MARKTSPVRRRTKKNPAQKPELVAITGLSGSGKASVLKALEDLGYYSVDNLPVELIPKFAELIRDNPAVRAALSGFHEMRLSGHLTQNLIDQSPLRPPRAQHKNCLDHSPAG